MTATGPHSTVGFGGLIDDALRSAADAVGRFNVSPISTSLHAWGLSLAPIPTEMRSPLRPFTAASNVVVPKPLDRESSSSN